MILDGTPEPGAQPTQAWNRGYHQISDSAFQLLGACFPFADACLHNPKLRVSGFQLGVEGGDVVRDALTQHFPSCFFHVSCLPELHPVRNVQLFL